MVAVIATMAVLALLGYVLPQLAGPKPTITPRAAVVHAYSHEPNPTEVLERVVEQRLHRCDVCGQVFVLSYERTLQADASGDTPIREQRVTCGRSSCRHTQVVVVPMTSRNHKTSEWLGAEEPLSAAPSLRTIQDGKITMGERGRPTKA